MSVQTYNGDSFSVAVTALGGVGEALQRIAGECEAERWLPAGSEQLFSFVAIAAASAEAWALTEALRFAATTALVLGEHLAIAQDWYEQVDATVRDTIAAVSDQLVATVAFTVIDLAAIGVGALIATLAAPGGLALAAATVATGALAVEAGWLPHPDAVLDSAADDLAVLFANPLATLAVRALVSSGDEIANGVIGLPPGSPLRLRSPEHLSSVVTSATDLVAGPSEFDLRADPVAAAATPGSIAEVVGTIPPSADGGPQVVITEFLAADGSTTYLVSVTGTSSGSYGGANPFDMRGNLAAFAQTDRESVAAVDAVMREHGITSDDAVVFAGYSQGALVTTALAASGHWSTQSMVTVGSPTHGNLVGGDVPIVQLEHSNDLVVALDGLPRAPANDVSVVVRNPHPDGVGADASILAGHSFSEYLETAAQYDALDDPQDAAHRAEVLAPLAGASVVGATAYTATRVAPPPHRGP